MTPEDRARRVVAGMDDGGRLQEEKETAIATAIREAVAAERERIRVLAEEVEAIYETSEPNTEGPGDVVSCHLFADLLRAGT